MFNVVVVVTSSRLPCCYVVSVPCSCSVASVSCDGFSLLVKIKITCTTSVVEYRVDVFRHHGFSLK